MTELKVQQNKYCRRCDTVKAKTEFYNDKSTKDGLCYECKDCVKKRTSAWQKANPEKALERHKEWVKRNEQRHKDTLAKYHSLGGWRVRWYKKSYGMSVEEVLEKITAQNGKCAICGSDDPRGRGQFHVDHDHETGQIRGMLCSWCNTALGLLCDNTEILSEAIKYLEYYKNIPEKRIWKK